VKQPALPACPFCQHAHFASMPTLPACPLCQRAHFASMPALHRSVQVWKPLFIRTSFRQSSLVSGCPHFELLSLGAAWHSLA
jgi:hypothetical protein